MSSRSSGARAEAVAAEDVEDNVEYADDYSGDNAENNRGDGYDAGDYGSHSSCNRGDDDPHDEVRLLINTVLGFGTRGIK